MLLLVVAASVWAQPVCRGEPLHVHFYDVEQGLAALVLLPGGGTILVDTGDAPNRAGCGTACKDANLHLLERLEVDLAGAPLDMVWITHPHSDHLGGVSSVAARFPISAYVDNGRDILRSQVARARGAAVASGATLTVIEPGHTQVPFTPANANVRLSALVPSNWLADCDEDANDCSIGLRIDYCGTSVLFTGDAETTEEALWSTPPVTLLQLGHHGSDTSSGSRFIAAVSPDYAVISAGGSGVGMNKTYCHPRASTVGAVTTALGGSDGHPILAFDASTACKKSDETDWLWVPSSSHLWATERDGDVELVTTGDGTFWRE